MKPKTLTDLEIAIKLEEIEKEETMKQTTVDWLFKELWDRPKDKMVWYYIFEKAKRMEKEQIIQAASTVLWNNNSNSNEVAEQYYKETYGKNA